MNSFDQAVAFAGDTDLEIVAAKPSFASNKFTAEVAARLLEKLASDDAYRALFLADAREALRQVGHVTPDAYLGIPGRDPVMCCINASTLASKADLDAARARLVVELSSVPFHFQADL